MTTTVPFGEARAQLRDLVCRAEYGGERITITRHGAPAAVLVSVRDLARLESAAGETGTREVGTADRTSYDVDVSTTIGAPLALVWNALLDRRRRTQWWVWLDLDARLGGAVRVDDWVDWDERIGRVVELVVGETIVVKFAGDGCSPDLAAEVRFEFAATGSGVTVRIRATGTGPDADFWQNRLDAWAAYAGEVSAALSSSTQS